MTMRGSLITLFICAAAAIACSGPRPKTVAAPSEQKFPEVKVPSMYTNQAQVMEYIAMHFWDQFTDTSRHFVCDTTFVSGVRKEVLGKHVGTFVGLISSMPLPLAQKAVSTAYDRLEAAEHADTSSNVYDAVTEMLTSYLYDANSPMRNEDIYLPFVQKLAVSPFQQKRRASYEFDARMCSLNQTGTKVANFNFTDLKGKKRDLYSVKADYILIFFSNPGCPACKDITDAILRSSKINSLIKERKLAVVNVYIDQDLEAWRNYAKEYPAEWYSGYNSDFDIRQDLSYSVRAIPSLYLLDGEHKVLLKDTPEPKMFQVLENLQ